MFVDELTKVTSASMSDTDILYVGRPGDPDPDRIVELGEMRKNLLQSTGGLQAFTPVLNGSSSNPTVTYTVQDGAYYRQGRLIFVSCALGWSALSSGSGDVRITGFGFTTDTSLPSAALALTPRSLNGITLTGGRSMMSIGISSGASWANILASGSGVNTAFVQVSALSSAGFITFSGVLLAAP